MTQASFLYQLCCLQIQINGNLHSLSGSYPPHWFVVLWLYFHRREDWQTSPKWTLFLSSLADSANSLVQKLSTPLSSDCSAPLSRFLRDLKLMRVQLQSQFPARLVYREAVREGWQLVLHYLSLRTDLKNTDYRRLKDIALSKLNLVCPSTTEHRTPPLLLPIHPKSL